MGYKIDWGENYIHIQYEGEVDLNEMIGMNGLISRNPKYNSLKYNISDFLGVTNLNISKKDIETLSAFHEIPSISNPNLKLVVVSDNNDIREKVLQYINLMKNNEWEVKLFDNLEASMEWGKQKLILP